VDLVSLLIWVAVAVIVLVAVYAILQRVPVDPAVRNIINIAVICVVAIVIVIILLKFTGSGGTVIRTP
jgi:hypothetical protein